MKQGTVFRRDDAVGQNSGNTQKASARSTAAMLAALPLAQFAVLLMVGPRTRGRARATILLDLAGAS